MMSDGMLVKMTALMKVVLMVAGLVEMLVVLVVMMADKKVDWMAVLMVCRKAEMTVEYLVD